MPSTTTKQARFMSAAAHNPSFAAKAGIPVSVAKEFHAADAGKKWGGKHKDTAGPKVAAKYKAEYHRNKQGGGQLPYPQNFATMLQPTAAPTPLPQQAPNPFMPPIPGVPGQQPRPMQPQPGQQQRPFQLGGDVVGMHKRPGQGAMENMYQGPIKSSVPGRTDKLRLDVKPGSYIMPADIVSGIGQGNTDAGHAMLKALFSPGGLGGGKMPQGKRSPMDKASGMTGPPAMPKHMGQNVMTGIGRPKSGMGMRPPRGGMGFHAAGGYAHGGDQSQGGPGVPIVAAGGEHVITPEEIIWKFGDLHRGHDILDQFVKARRAQHIKEQKALPPPKKKYGGRV